jgi:hypothetical protein
MNKKLGVIIIVSILLILNIDTGSTINQKNILGEKKEWTYIYYLGGDDLSYPLMNLTDRSIDFITKIPIPYNNKINAVCLLDLGKSFLCHFKRVGLFRAKIKIIEEYDELNFLNYTTLRDFILRCKTEYPANRYFLRIQGHGFAWAGAIHDQVTDEGYNPLSKVLTVNEIHKALYESGGVDILELASCYMGSFEAAYEFRNSTDVIIGCEPMFQLSAAIPTLINDMTVLQRYYYKSSETIAKKLVKRFRMSHPYRFTPFYVALELILSIMNGKKFDLSENTFPVSTFSAIRTNKLDDVCKAINDLGELFIENLDNCREFITNCRKKSEGYPGRGINISRLVDIYDFADIIVNNYTNYSNISTPDFYNVSLNLRESFKEAVIENWAQEFFKNSHGLSLFFPLCHNYSYTEFIPHWDMQNYTSHKLEFTEETCWDEFLELFLN